MAGGGGVFGLQNTQLLTDILDSNRDIVHFIHG